MSVAPASIPHLRLIQDEDSPDYDAGESTTGTYRMVPDGVIALGNPYATHLYAVMLGIGKRRRSITASWNVLATASGLNRKTVQKTLTFLESKGYVTTAKRSSGGRKISDEITLHNTPVMVPVADQHPDLVVHGTDHSMVHETDHGGVPDGPLNGDVTTETYLDTPHTPDNEANEEEEEVTFEERFETFWTAYPKKRSKGDARKAFKAAKVDDALLARMLAALDQQRVSDQWVKSGGQFIPYPAGWIRDEAWEDVLEVEPIKPSQPNPLAEAIAEHDRLKRGEFISPRERALYGDPMAGHEHLAARIAELTTLIEQGAQA